MNDRVELARRLREEGLTQVRIAERLGVTQSTISKWLNPARRTERLEKDREWKARNREHIRARDRAYNASRAHPCALGCGRLASHAAEVCQACHTKQRADAAKRRDDRIVQMWDEGLGARAITEAVGWKSVNAMNVQIVRLRREGRIGYRYAVENGRREAA